MSETYVPALDAAMPGGSPAPGSRLSWDEDYRNRMNPRLLTELLREAVPVLAYVDWRVSETAEGCATSLLPLNRASTNQHGTHQAALIALAADYTGAIALAAVLRGTPIVGIHPHSSDDGASGWLVHLDIAYAAPSTSDLTLRARITPDSAEQIRRTYESGNHCIERIEISIESDGEQVARAFGTYYVKQARRLRPQKADGKVSTLFQHQAKASARLIAGLRATENESANPLFRDPHSAIAAGQHGRLLARRHMDVLPQLRDMVAARTRHIDDLISKEVDGGTTQVVFVGVGLDFRAFRLLAGRPSVRAYEIDLPLMLAERERIIAKFPPAPRVARTTIGMNLELEDIGEKLLSCSDFDPCRSSVFVFEGMSMYFDESTNRKLLASMRRLLAHPRSVLWLDAVSKSVVERTSGLGPAEEFMRAMEKLGEPFVFGLEDGGTFFAREGWRVVEAVFSSYRLGLETDPIYRLYTFHVLSNAAVGLSDVQAARDPGCPR